MGFLLDGKWVDQWYDTKSTGGKFERKASQFRNWITADGESGPDGQKGFKAEAGRYHLYVSYACPWAHRTLIFRKLKKLEDLIDVSVVDHFMGSDGWTFKDDDGGTGDTLFGLEFLRDIYVKADSKYSGRVTVPVLWDKKEGTIVSNESSEIIRMFNSEFDHLTGNNEDYYPEELRAGIDEINKPIYDNFNNGVYRCGFATKKEAYEEAYGQLFETMDMLENRLSENRYLMGDRLTEADWRLFTTLIRFDHVYYSHFKCNRNRLTDMPALSGYTRELYQMPGIAETVNMYHIKEHYFGSHETINPTRIVPVGPEISFDGPHGRG